MKKFWTQPLIVNINSTNVKGGTSTNTYPYEKYVSGCGANSASTCIATYLGTFLSYSTGAAPSTLLACVNEAGTAVTAAGRACAS